MKTHFLSFTFFLLTLCVCFVPNKANAAGITIIEAKGWLESAYATWSTADADSFTVYYSGQGIVDQQIDTQLIRSYGSYYRADALGLAPGNYTMKIVPVINDAEDFSNAAVTSSLTVLAHDRSGFAFSNGRVPGAYKADGTPKDGALILYITENTKNTLSVTVTGATANPCVGLQTILDGFKKGNDTRPLIIRLIGQVTDPSYMLGGDIVIENKNNANSYITLEGVGDDAVADGWGIRVKNASNVEIRNIGTMNCDSDEGDNIGLQQENEYIWVHNCDFFYGHAGSDSDQQKGDGALDCKRSKYVTFSYNHFWDSGKSSLLGNNDGEYSYYITYHHNWFDHSDSRHPRVRCFSTHVYNNYYDGISKYGIGATVGSSIFAEGNYFRNCKYPMLISMQGSDVWDNSKQANDYTNMPTFSKDDGGMIKAYNNYIEGATRFVPYGNSSYPNATVDFDAYVVTDKNTTIPNTIQTYKGAKVYDNFDTNSSVMYSYVADSPEDAKTKVTTYAGRMFGGDFEWTFNNAVDDVSYAVNAALKTALTSYETALVSIQGDGSSSGGGIVVPPIGGGDKVHNFTLHGTTNSFYNITGSVTSGSGGTVVVDGETLSKYLKMESSTSITFTAEDSGTLTLVFAEASGKKVEFNETVYDIPSTGVLVIDIEAGNGKIAKGSKGTTSTFLFYMSLEYDNSGTGIESVTNSKLTLYPNPVSDNLYISSEAEVESIEIYSLTGVLMFSSNENIDSVNMSSFAAGNYIVKVRTNEGTNQKLIIKK